MKDAQTILHSFGMNPALLGYRYLLTILEMELQPGGDCRALCDDIYVETAQKHNSTAGRVERAVRHAIEKSFGESHSIQKEIFPYLFETGRRPTNREFIAGVAEYMKNASDNLPTETQDMGYQPEPIDVPKRKHIDIAKSVLLIYMGRLFEEYGQKLTDKDIASLTYFVNEVVLAAAEELKENERKM